MSAGSSAFESAPPPGISISGQSVESRVWRVQVDLATGGVRSLRWRGAVTRELADAEREPHLFQAVLRGVAGAAGRARYLRSQVKFDEKGARLAVESELGGGVWRTEFSVDVCQTVLEVRAGWAGAPVPGAVEVVVPACAEAAPEAAWHPERGTVSPPPDGPLVIRLTGLK